VLAALPERLWGSGQERQVPFLGKAVGFVINYSPDSAARFSLTGDPLEVLSKAYRPGEVVLSIGRRVVSATVMAKLISAS
jgi:hypothetical protein